MSEPKLKSCFNCRHVHIDRDPGYYWQPESVELSCNKVNGYWNQADTEEEFDVLEDAAAFCATFCSLYEYEPPAPEPPDMFLTSEQEKEIDRMAREYNEYRMKKEGLLDKDGNPTDKFYEQGQLEYEIKRGK